MFHIGLRGIPLLSSMGVASVGFFSIDWLGRAYNRQVGLRHTGCPTACYRLCSGRYRVFFDTPVFGGLIRVGLLWLLPTLDFQEVMRGVAWLGIDHSRVMEEGLCDVRL